MNKKWTAGLLISLLMVAGCGGSGSGDKKAEQKAVTAKDEIVITVGNNLVAGKFDPTIGYGVWNPDIFHSHIFKVGKGNTLEISARMAGFIHMKSVKTENLPMASRLLLKTLSLRLKRLCPVRLHWI